MQKVKWAVFFTERTFIHKIEAKYNLESDLEVSLQFVTDWCYEKMKAFCVKCREKTENLNPNISKTKNGILIMQSKCTECGITKSRFVREQEAKGLLNNLIIKTA